MNRMLSRNCNSVVPMTSCWNVKYKGGTPPTSLRGSIISRLDVVILMTPRQYHRNTATTRELSELEDLMGFFIHFEFMSLYRNDCGFFLRFGIDEGVVAAFPLRRGRPGRALSIPLLLGDVMVTFMVTGPLPFKLCREGFLLSLDSFLRRLLPPFEMGGVRG